VRLRGLRVRVRLCWRRPLTTRPLRPELPAEAVLSAQAEALAAMRSRLLRRVGIAHRGPVLDLGAGSGAVTAELVRRSRGPVVAFDRHPDALAGSPAHQVAVGEATALPFGDASFALVFAQCVFLWNGVDTRAAILAEVRRVLSPRGVLLAVEPDWGGAMEHPEAIAIAPVASDALARAGADPKVGRRLPSELRRAGFDVRVELFPEIGTTPAGRYALLEGLPFTEAERARVREARAAEARLPPGETLVHVPFVFVTATRP